MSLAHVISAGLEREEFVADAFFDEYPSGMLSHDGFFILHMVKDNVLANKAFGVISRQHEIDRLTLIIDSSTFSISPGFTVPSGRPLRPCSLFSFASILRSSCGILSLAYRSLRSNISRILTRQSLCFFRSSRTPSSHARASSSRRDCAVDMCFAVA